MDRHLAAGEGVDLLLDDVAGDHRVTELGEAGGGDEPDPARSDDADRLPLLAHHLLLPLLRLLLRDEHLGRPRHPDHLIVGQRSQQVVGDPVDVVPAVPGDNLHIFAVDVDVVVATVDRLRQARVVEDRRVGPAADPLHAEVMGAVAHFRHQHHPVGKVAVSVFVLEVVDVGIDDLLVGVGFDEAGAFGQARRVVDREEATRAPGGDLRLGLARFAPPGRDRRYRPSLPPPAASSASASSSWLLVLLALPAGVRLLHGSASGRLSPPAPSRRRGIPAPRRRARFCVV